MDNPHGLTISEDDLYICEGEHGLKVFDKTNINEIGDRQLNHLTGFMAFDIIAIPNSELAMVIGRDGLYQFDISNPRQLKEISVIPVIR